MDILFIISFIPIFGLLLIPIIFIRDEKLVILWLLIDIFTSWKIASEISSFAHEQWVIATTSFATHPFWEAFEVAIISGLSLVGVAALIFCLYFIPIYLLFLSGSGEQGANQLPRRSHGSHPISTARSYERARLRPVPREVVKRILEEDEP